MSQENVDLENVEIVRRAIDAFNRRDFDAALKDAAPDAAVDMSYSRGPDAGVYVGADAVGRFWTDMTEPFEGHTMVPVEFVPHREHVVVSLTARMGGRGGIEVEAKTATVATLSDGRLVRWTMYRDRAEALEAVGPGEQAVDRPRN
jgi:ketosteroid isomerase-like protein